MYHAKLLAFAIAATGALAQTAGTSNATTAQLGPKVPGSNTLYYCSDPSDYKMTLSDVSITPLPPKAGENVTSSISGSLSKPITNGAKHTMEFGKIENSTLAPIGSHTQDLCKNLDMIPDVVIKHFHGEIKQCPIEAGAFNMSKTHAIPEPPKALKGLELPELPKPSGEYYVKASTTLADGSMVACIVADLKAPEGEMMSS